ncbi:MAG: Conserved repeat domain protein [Pedosphaera sp.]|nr:Conserved repeat domain protein [Pedosphaera sp.]
MSIIRKLFHGFAISAVWVLALTQIEASPLHGTVVAWGDNSYAQTNVPAGLVEVQTISAGQYHNLALKNDGTVISWGDNTYGQATVPPNLSNVIAVAAGYKHSLVLKTNGTIVGWGNNNNGQLSFPASLTNITAISAGNLHSLALKSDGTISACGYNGFGQASPPAGLSNVVAISAGGFHSLCLINDGTVVSFGNLAVPSLTNAISIAAGYLHGMALKADGTTVAWGDNTYGQTIVPAGLSNVVAIAAGQYHSMALKADGTVVAWGRNEAGQIIVPANIGIGLGIAGGGAHSLVLRLGAPVVIVNPTDLHVSAGDGATFTVQASGAPPLSYQWQFKGNPIAGATNSILTFEHASLTNVGAYQVVINNPWGSVASLPAILDVTAASPQISLQPQNQVVASGSNVTLIVTASGVGPFYYQWQFNGADLPGATDASLVMNGITSAQAGDYAVIVANPFDSIRSESARLTVDPGLLTPLNIDFGSTMSNKVGFAAIGQTTNDFWNVFNGTSTNGYVLANSLTLGNRIKSLVGLSQYANTMLRSFTYPDGMFKTYMSSRPGTSNIILQYYGMPAGFYDLYLYGHGAGNTSNGVYRIVASTYTTNTVPLEAGATDYGTRATTNGPGWDSTDFQEGIHYVVFRNVLVTNRNAGFTVFVNQGASSSALIAGMQIVPSRPSPPFIVVQPQDKLSNPGNSAFFSVEAGGDLNTRYQWRFNGVTLAGATNTSFVLSNVQATNAGNYSVVVSNLFGYVLSTNAILKLNVPAYIITEPQNQHGVAGTNITFSVVAGGDAPLIYQWKFANTDIPGATNSTLTVTNAGAESVGYYRVVVSNFATALSQNALLSLDYPPAILVQPDSQTANLGASSITFSVFAAGTDPLFFQWRLNGVNVPDATNRFITLNNIQTSFAGNYSLLITNAFGSLVSSNAVLTVYTPPSITVPPVTQVVMAGSNAVFSVTAQGSAPLKYQWKYNGNNLPGASNSSLVITNVQLANAGSYAVVVSNSLGIATSPNAILSVTAPPTIINPPQSQSVLVGMNTQFTVNASGSLPLYYQWQFNSTDLAGATGSNLNLNNVLTNQAGIYGVIISNTFGTVTSPTASLTVNVPAQITTQPQDQNAIAGTNVTISVTAMGTAPLSYQWRFNGTNIAGALSSDLVLSNVQLSHAGSYSVTVSNAFNFTTSSNAILTVFAPPLMIVQPQSLTVSAGSDVVLSGTASGYPLAYQWQFNGMALAGATNSNLTLPNVQSANAGDYVLVVSNFLGMATSDVAILTVNPAAPVILVQPQNRFAYVSSSASFTVKAVGTMPLAYQWFINGAAWDEATNSSLTITNVQPADFGTVYSVSISNVIGSVMSSNATLNFLSLVSLPQSLSVTGAQEVVYDSTRDLLYITTNGNAILRYQVSSNTFLPPYVMGGVLSRMDLSLDESTLVVADGHSNLTSSNWIWFVNLNTGVSRQVRFPLAYYETGTADVAFGNDGTVLVTSYNGGTDAVPLRRYDPILDTTTQVATVLSGSILCRSADGSVIGVAEPGSSSGPIVRYDVASTAVRYVTAINNFLTDVAVNKDGTQFAVPASTGMFIYDSNLTKISTIGPGGGSGAVGQVYHPSSNLLFLAWGASSEVRVYKTDSLTEISRYDFGRTFNNALLRVSPDGSLLFALQNGIITYLRWPVAQIIISQQPVSRSALAGTNVTFTVGAKNGGPFNYQWQLNGFNLPDATNASLVLTNVQSVDAGNYNVMISTPASSTNSATAVLTVNYPPSITAHPQKQTVSAGANATFNVTATGTGTLNYQWKFNGTNLIGATSSTLNLANVQFASMGNYTVTVSSPYGNVLSSNAFLTVNSPPFVTQNPQTQPVVAGTNFSLTVGASGSTPLSYQWRNNGVEIAGAINSVLAFTNTQLSDAGVYSVVITNAFGSVTSLVANITVIAPPVITSVSPDQTVPAGTDVTFSVAATGNPLNYQWLYNGISLGGATTTSLTRPNVQANNNGFYNVIVSNSLGSATSGPINLTVTPSAPVITVQPQSRTLPAGTNVTFTVTAMGTTPLSYQWQFNGTNIPGRTSSSHVAANIQDNNSGNYTVLLTNSVGSVLSDIAVLTVTASAPTILTQPTNMTATIGGELVLGLPFSVVGSAPLQCQWQFQGIDLPGATNTILGLTNVQYASTGVYNVVVSNNYGSLSSTSVTATVTPPPGFLWTRTGNNPSNNSTNAQVTVDDNGNVYVAGFFNSKFTLGSLNLTNTAGSQDIYLAKFDSAGNLVWGVTAGGPSVDAATGIAVDAVGNIYLTGSFQGTATFGSTNISSTGGQSIFLAKYDTNGNLLWIQKGGGTASYIASAVATDEAGSCYLAGSFNGAAVFGSTGITVSAPSAFVAKYNTNGDFIWVRNANNNGQTVANSLAIDGGGNALITGSFFSSINFGTGSTNLTSSGIQDVFIAKFDAAGKFLWEQKGGGIKSDIGNAIAADRSGNVYVAGNFQSLAYFNTNSIVDNATNFTLPNAVATFDGDIFIAKYSSSGSPLWIRSGGSRGQDSVTGLAVDAGGNAYLAGSIAGTAAFGSSIATNSGDSDAYIAVYDAAGNVRRVQTIGSISTDIAQRIAIDKVGNVYAIGYFSGRVTFGNTLSANGNKWPFLTKMAAFDSATPPVITSQPMNQSALLGDKVAFDIGVNSLAPLTYRWQFNGVDIPQATNATLILTNIQLPDAGNYGVVLSNTYGTNVSASAMLKAEFVPDYSWARQAGGTSADSARAIAVDGSGNAYITGVYLGNAVFGPLSLTNNSGVTNFDIFIAKYDVAGNVIWAKQAGGKLTDSSRGIAADQSGNTYVTGSFQNIANFGDISLTNASANNSIFTVKYDNAGNPIWAAQAGAGNMESRAVAVDNDRNVFVAGYFSSTILFGTSGTNSFSASSPTNIFLVKYDGDGNLIWARRAGSTGFINGNYSDCYALAVDNSGNVFITGAYRNNLLLGTNLLVVPTANGNTANPFVAKYDSAGNVLWARQGIATTSFGNALARGNAITVDGSGNSFVAGPYQEAVSFGGYALNWAVGSVFLTKYDPSGNVLWAKGMGTYVLGNASIANAYGICLDYFGNPIVTGTNGIRASFATASLNAGTFAAKYSSSGEFLWARSFTGSALAAGVANGPSNSIYIAGTMTNFSANFGVTNMVSSGPGDAFIARIGINPPGLTAQPTNQLAVLGSNATLRVTAIGTGPLSYQWQFNGSSIAGATKSILTLTNVHGPNAGNYSVVIRNPNGTIVSPGANLTVMPVVNAPAFDGTNFIISWSDTFILQISTNGINGPYFDAPDATSPYTNNSPAGDQFFRLRN